MFLGHLVLNCFTVFGGFGLYVSAGFDAWDLFSVFSEFDKMFSISSCFSAFTVILCCFGWISIQNGGKTTKF